VIDAQGVFFPSQDNHEAEDHLMIFGKADHPFQDEDSFPPT
jgi:hypothetical protein